MQKRQRNVQKVWCTCGVVVLLSKPYVSRYRRVIGSQSPYWCGWRHLSKLTIHRVYQELNDRIGMRYRKQCLQDPPARLSPAPSRCSRNFSRCAFPTISEPGTGCTWFYKTSCDRIYNARHKSWNNCVIFPFPNVDLGITVVSVLQNTRGSTLGKERGTFEWERGCQEWM